jgi:hypothetical protein
MKRELARLAKLLENLSSIEDMHQQTLTQLERNHDQLMKDKQELLLVADRNPLLLDYRQLQKSMFALDARAKEIRLLIAEVRRKVARARIAQKSVENKRKTFRLEGERLSLAEAAEDHISHMIGRSRSING